MSTSEINSITIGPRQSNFELLRILAMFLVIVIHVDFFVYRSAFSRRILCRLAACYDQSFI